MNSNRHNNELKSFFKMMTDLNNNCNSIFSGLKEYVQDQNKRRDDLDQEKSELLSQLIELRQVVGSSLITRRLISINNQLDSIDNERSSQRSIVARSFDLSNSIRRKTRSVYTTKVSFDFLWFLQWYLSLETSCSLSTVRIWRHLLSVSQWIPRQC